MRQQFLTGLLLLLLLMSFVCGITRAQQSTSDATPQTGTAQVQSRAQAPSDAHAKATRRDQRRRATPSQLNETSEAAGERPRPSATGSSGLWDVHSADTLARGQVSIGTYLERFGRMPGALTVTQQSIVAAVGINDWMELSMSNEPIRSIRAASPEQLSLSGMPFRCCSNYSSISNDFPFVSRLSQRGPGDAVVTFKVNLLSEDRGAPFGASIEPFVEIPYRQDYTTVAGKSVTTGEFSWSPSNFIFEKYLGDNFGELIANVALLKLGSPDRAGVRLVQLRPELRWGIGAAFPRYSTLQLLAETDGNTPFGTGVHSNYYGPSSPVESTVGLRWNPLNAWSINAGYRYLDNGKFGNRSGFVLGFTYVSPPPLLIPPPTLRLVPPPAVACIANADSVEAGTPVRVRFAISPAGHAYNYQWASSGGVLRPEQDQAELDTNGLAPGMYTVSVRAAGSTGTASCSTSVQVREKPKPPVVSCAVNPSTVRTGETATLTAQAESPDQHPLAYQWLAAAGQLKNDKQAEATWNTTGAQPGALSANVVVTDDRGLTAQCATSLTVEAPPPPPPPTPAAPAPVATQLQQTGRATLRNIHFANASYRVRPESSAIIDEIAQALRTNPGWRIRIEGHTDSIGGPDYNLRLSRKRAEAVRAALIARGIDPSRLTTAGYGDTRPIGSNQTPAGRSLNRRVELVREQ